MPPSPPSTLGDLAGAELQEALGRAADWAAAYLAGVGELPVLSASAPGQVRGLIPAAPPDAAEPLTAVLDDFERVVLPGITHWNHPRFFGYFGITGSVPGIVAELLCATLNVNAMLWRASPAATEVEEAACDWLRQALGLDAGLRGHINDTASTSTFYALGAAREAAVPGARERGVDGTRLRLYTSAEAHSSVDKAGIALGIGLKGVVKVPVDAQLRMDPERLRAAIRADRRGGLVPFAVVATVGTTSTTSVDPVPAIASIAAEEGLWLHVDAAYGGAAAVLPGHRHVLDGCEAADSVVVNPHKWLFTPIDCSVLYLRDEGRLRRAFSLVPEYLRTGEGAEVRNLMDYGTALGRRFRGLKLWFVLRAFGLEGIRARIAAHVEMAAELRAWIEADPDFEVLAPTPFSTVVFRHREGDARNQALLDAVNASGHAFMSHTKVGGALALRIAIGNIRTTPADVRSTWELIRHLAAGPPP